MKKREVTAPVPNQVSEAKNYHHHDDIERKEIWGERNEEICFGDDDVAAARGGFEFFDFAAENPDPHGVGQFMTDDIEPHWFWQKQKNDDPTRCAREHGNPGGVDVPGPAQHESERLAGTAANRQEQERHDELSPLWHGPF